MCSLDFLGGSSPRQHYPRLTAHKHPVPVALDCSPPPWSGSTRPLLLTLPWSPRRGGARGRMLRHEHPPTLVTMTSRTACRRGTRVRVWDGLVLDTLPNAACYLPPTLTRLLTTNIPPSRCHPDALAVTLPAKGGRYAYGVPVRRPSLFTSMTERRTPHGQGLPAVWICRSYYLPQEGHPSGLSMNSVGSLKHLKFGW